MQYRPFGRTGLKVSSLVLGTDNLANPTPEAESLAILDAAVAGGINLIDTSNSYAGAGDALFRPVVQGAVDGNTVDMDVERNAYVDNGIRYEASLTMITGQIKKMLTAINGQ